MAEACRTFRAHPASLRLIRDFVREQADRSRLAEIADDLVLATSEAAGNAILHSEGDRVDVAWRLQDHDVEIEVRDEGVFKPRVRLPFDEGGRGIFVMMSVMDEVSIREGRPDRPGTVVRLVKHDHPAAAWTA